MPYAEQLISTQVLLGLLKDYNRPYDKIMELVHQEDLFQLRKGLYMPARSSWILSLLLRAEIPFRFTQVTILEIIVRIQTGDRNGMPLVARENLLRSQCFQLGTSYNYRQIRSAVLSWFH